LDPIPEIDNVQRTPGRRLVLPVGFFVRDEVPPGQFEA